MAFLVRLLVNLVLFLLITGAILGAIYLVLLVVNRGIQWLAYNAGYEVQDLFQWLKDRLPKRKEKHEERLGNRETVSPRGLQEHQVHDDSERHTRRDSTE